MHRVLEGAKGYSPGVLAGESGNRIIGVLSYAIVTHSARGRFPLTARTIVVGGPLGDSAIVRPLLKALDGKVARKSVLCQVRNIVASPDPSPFLDLGYTWEDHIDFVLDLTRGDRALLQGMSKARRKGIAQADRHGLSLRVDDPNVEQNYSLLRATYERAKIPLADRSLFESAWKHLRVGGNLWVMDAILEGLPCASRWVLRWGDHLYDWYAGSSDRGRETHADEWLVWQVLSRGVREGLRTFDFGGAGRPGEEYGPGEFKRRFGGEVRNPGRFEKTYRPIARRAAGLAYRIWRKLP